MNGDLIKAAFAAHATPGELARAQRKRATARAERAARDAEKQAPRPPEASGDEASAPQRIEVEGARWVVAFVGASAAREVAADLTALGFRAYCPMGRKVVHRARSRRLDGKRERKVISYPVFGGYLFVGETGQQLTRSTHARIVEVLGERPGARPVPGKVIAAINALELAGEWDAASAPVFLPGAKVRPKAHPLAGLCAVVAGLPKGLRVELDIALFGGVRAVANARHLEAA